MFKIFATDKIARFSATRPWLIVALWAVLLGAGMYLASGISDVLTSDASVSEDLESDTADQLIEERMGFPQKASEQVIISHEELTVDSPLFQAKVKQILADLRGIETVETATSYYETKFEQLVSADRHITIVPVVLRGDEDDAEDNAEPIVDYVKSQDSSAGFDVLTAGDGSISLAWVETAEKDFSGEFKFGIPAALIILLIVFGALVAAGVPVVLGVASIVIAVGMTALLGRAFELSSFVLNMISMIGMAVGIDYSLFIVERFREERRSGIEKVEAIVTAAATSGRAVLFAGITVVVALSGMLIMPDSIFRSLAAGAIIVAVTAVLAALTLLPAVLALLGDKVNALSIPFLSRKGNREGGFWGAIGDVVMRRPVLSIVGSVAVLSALAAPYFTMELGQSGVSTLPKSVDAFRGYEILDREFSAGIIAPMQIVVDAGDARSPEVQAAIKRLQDRLAQDPAFGASSVEYATDGSLAIVSAPVNGDPQDNFAHRALDRVRGDYAPAAFGGSGADVYVTGPTAWTADYVDLVNKYTPYVFGFVLGLSFLVLLVVFRSIVVPVKAIIMNLLSVGASYGLIVAVFQHGFLADQLGFTQVDRIEAWLPLFLFAVLFGLSMDYHVFLLSRVRERFDVTHNNRESVAYGLRSTAGIITGAALIMVAVFSGFAIGSLVSFQQMGFGLAVAVILDATLVRSVLVPASMVLLGDANWYLPSWLKWLPTIRIEGAPAHGMPLSAAPAAPEM